MFGYSHYYPLSGCSVCLQVTCPIWNLTGLLIVGYVNPRCNVILDWHGTACVNGLCHNKLFAHSLSKWKRVWFLGLYTVNVSCCRKTWRTCYNLQVQNLLSGGKKVAISDDEDSLSGKFKLKIMPKFFNFLNTQKFGTTWKFEIFGIFLSYVSKVRIKMTPGSLRSVWKST